MEEDSEVVAGELMYSTERFSITANRIEEFLQSIGYYLDRIVEQGVIEKKFSFVPVSQNGTGKTVRGRVHLIWEVENGDDLQEAAERLHDLGFI